MYLIYDLESTGLNVKTDDVTQIACLLVDRDYSIKDARNRFVNTERLIGAKVYKVTGVSNADLKMLSGNLFLEDIFYRDFGDLFYREDIIFVGHNIVSFDNRLLNNNLDRLGMNRITFKHCVDTRYTIPNTIGGKLPNYKLDTILKYCMKEFNFTLDSVESAVTRVRNKFSCNCSVGEVVRHDALYDCLIEYGVIKALQLLG